MTTPAPIAALLLNDTFPNPLGILVALFAWILPVVMAIWVGKRLVRHRPIPWPPALLAVSAFVGTFLLAILADTRFPSARWFEDAVGAVASVLLIPGMMLALPFLGASASHLSARESGIQHLALAVGGTVFWYLIALGRNLLRAAPPEAAAETAPRNDA